MIKHSLVRIKSEVCKEISQYLHQSWYLYKYCIINLINHDDKDIRKIDLSYKNLNLLVR